MVYNRKKELSWVLFPLAVGAVSGFLSRQGMANYEVTAYKPSLSPPAIIFPVVWTILYLLMGIGTARINRLSLGRDKSAALNVFFIQLVVNFFWSLFFFNTHAYGFSFVWLLLLLILAVIMAVLYYREDKIAGLIQIPYIIWLLFAAYLNYEVWQRNR